MVKLDQLDPVNQRRAGNGPGTARRVTFTMLVTGWSESLRSQRQVAPSTRELLLTPPVLLPLGEGKDGTFRRIPASTLQLVSEPAGRDEEPGVAGTLFDLGRPARPPRLTHSPRSESRPTGTDGALRIGCSPTRLTLRSCMPNGIVVIRLYTIRRPGPAKRARMVLVRQALPRELAADR